MAFACVSGCVLGKYLMKLVSEIRGKIRKYLTFGSYPSLMAATLFQDLIKFLIGYFFYNAYLSYLHIIVGNVM
jgi:hypothetical protein